jgi:hypothetical protein
MSVNPFESDVEFLEQQFENDQKLIEDVTGDAAPMNKKRISVEERDILRDMLRTDPEFRNALEAKHGRQHVDEFVGGGA